MTNNNKGGNHKLLHRAFQLMTTAMVLIFVAVVLQSRQPAPNKPAAGAANQAAIKTFDDLNRVMHAQPQSIKRLVFVNGRNEVKVERDGEPETVVIPDKYGQQYLMGEAEKLHVAVDAKVSSDHPVLMFLLTYLPFLLFAGLIVLLFTAQARFMKGFGKRRNTKSLPTRPVRFEEIAGIGEVKEKLAGVVDYLKHPQKYQRMGVTKPAHILLMGKPGTGKTLCGRAIATEAGVPFYYLSGSELIEMFVGVGAARVRDLFAQAKRTAPSIIFIDEIDAMGRQRGAGMGTGHDEREQTLNQLLTEIDGFESHEFVVCIAATNRPDVLDPALIRPGRFGHKYVVNIPDLQGRKEIFQINAKDKPIAPDVNFDQLAAQTHGMSGADIAESFIEAARMAARRNQTQCEELIAQGLSEAEADARVPWQITMEDLHEGIIEQQIGLATKTRMSPEELERTAYHEAGHALLSNDPVITVSIVERGLAGGWTLSLPELERRYWTKNQLIDRIIMMMGGRAAEELIYQGQYSTGASNDYEQAMSLARDMVEKYGMSRLGPISVPRSEGGPFLALAVASRTGIGARLSDAIDDEVRLINNWCLERAREGLIRRRDLLEECAQRLLVRDDILGAEFAQMLANRGMKPYSYATEEGCPSFEQEPDSQISAADSAN